MNTTVYTTPFCLIPKIFFNEEKKRDYLDIFFEKPISQFMGKEEMDSYFLIYSTQTAEESTHIISLMYKNIKEITQELSDVICVNVYEDELFLLVLKKGKVEYAGFNYITVKEDVVYHIANVAQQFFENNSQPEYYYLQLIPEQLRLLCNYFTMKKL
ncbi:MAG: DUF3822 family protein [Bacteroidales bacterium]|jgi:hypothetical protein|nr:DUF3822 family protein [Bacteroidales bacterium]